MTIHEEIKKSEYVLYSDEDILLTLDYDPISIGHVLILPQQSYLDIDDLPPLVLHKIAKAAQVYIRLVKLKFSTRGYSIMQNGGRCNDIGVFHMHVFPRFSEDEFGYQNKEVNHSIDCDNLRQQLKDEVNEYR